MGIAEVCSLLGVFLTTFCGVCAFISAKLGLMTWRQMQREEELSRPCVGESSWRVIDGNAFVKIKIWPGKHFVQTKSIRIPGYKLSRVVHSTFNGKDFPYSRKDELDSLPVGISIPVNSDVVEIEFAVSPVPTAPFKVLVNLARGEHPIEYQVLEDPTSLECASKRSNP